MKKGIQLRVAVFYALILVAILVSIREYWLGGKPGPAPYRIDSVGTPINGITKFASSFVCNPCSTSQVHSPTISQGAKGNLLTAWFGGTREGAKDVSIYFASKSSSSGGWSNGQSIVSRAESSNELKRYIKKIGNPVLGRDGQGRVWLFYVTVSAGGWSGSSISYKISNDDGLNWSNSRKLVTSPFFNVSTLVRGSPVPHSDGSISLPVYHELLGKYGELLRIDPDGKVRSKKRINYQRKSFQPSMAAISEYEAVMVLRSTSNSISRIFLSVSDDGGESWTEPVPTQLPNPDSGVAVIGGFDGSWLIVYNDSENHRGNLALAISRDKGRTWKRIHYFEGKGNSGAGEEFSYPAIIRQEDRYHLVYTWKRKGIRYVTFSHEWVLQKESN